MLNNKTALKFTLIILFAFVIIPRPLYSADKKNTDEAQKIYDKSKELVCQIKVINTSTGQKASIGSGFLIDKEGHIATNYHVIASAVRFPARNRIEYLRADGSSGILKVIDFDVIHDLAITQEDKKAENYLELTNTPLSKGARIFAMGNPLDLGTVIVEGTYNGLMEESLYPKILFSGSLNPGMSGGPALNHYGEVIGVNVSTMGNEISFFVPAEYLKALYARLAERGNTPITDWDKETQAQLLKNQDEQINNLINSDWKTSNIKETFVPAGISKNFKCWANSEDNEKDLYKTSWLHCSSEDKIYLDSDFSTGKIEYRYTLIEGKGLNSMRFYNNYEKFFSYHKYYQNAQEYDVTNFKCNSDFVTLGQTDWKASICSRQYKKMPELYDTHMSMASTDKKHSGLIIELSILGTNKNKAIEFIEKFFSQIQWQKP